MIAVTGAAGFVGRQVVAQLRERGERVRAVIRRPAQAPVVEHTGAEVVYADLRDEPAMASALEGADGLIHTAAILRERGGATYQSVNVDGAAVVYRAAAEAGVGRAVQISAIGADADSPEPYFASRAAGERHALDSGVPTVVLRFSAGFGAGDEFTNLMAALVRLGPLVVVPGSGQARFQPIHVEDAARTIVQAIMDGVSATGPVEVGGPEILSYDEILDEVARTLGRRVLKLHAPLRLLAPVVRIMDVVLRTPPVTSHQLSMLRLDNVAAPNGFMERFGFSPRPLCGNIDYVRNVGIGEALRILSGRMPRHIRDH